VVTGTAVFLAIPFIISFSMDKRNARRTPEA
jgi:amino acid transporter protein